MSPQSLHPLHLLLVSGPVFFLIAPASPALSSPPDYKELSLRLSEGLVIISLCSELRPLGTEGGPLDLIHPTGTRFILAQGWGTVHGTLACA